MIDVTAPIRDWMPTQVYVGHRRGMPDVIMGRWPPEIATGHGMSWKTWICETPKEFKAVQKRLSEPCPLKGGALDFRSGPDGALSPIAVGMQPLGQIVVALYPSPAEDWPWLVLLSVWAHDPTIERGRYSWEAMPTEQAALDHLARMAALAPDFARHILLPETRQ